MASSDNQSITHSPYVPVDPNVVLYVGKPWAFHTPYEFTGWRREQLSWKEGAYLHAGLNPSPTTRISGPDTLAFLSAVCTNNFSKFAVGAGKHAVLCSEAGHIMAHGVVVRTGEDEVIAYWLAPYLVYLAVSGQWDVTVENVPDEFLFQVAGPRTLEIMETAAGESLRDIKFFRHRRTSIAGADVRILRVGMGGTLAYEIHGKTTDALRVYEAIFSAGQPLGMRKLGLHSYVAMNHTENGFPQGGMHFQQAFAEDPGFTDWLAKQSFGGDTAASGESFHMPMRGSLGSSDESLRYVNPLQAGWGKSVQFDHDFIGRAALEKEAANPTRVVVTLEWNVDDVLDVHRSQFDPGEHYLPIEEPSHFMNDYFGFQAFADRVETDGTLIGFSSGRIYSYYYRRMISMAFLAPEHAEIGSEVTVIWGDEGTRQKKIRAVVARYPYLDLPRNEAIDVTDVLGS